MSQQIDTALLRTFVAIAESGSFTRGANMVHRTQSAVSMQMKRLETFLGRPLFLRQGRNAKLTREGEELLDSARRVLRLLDDTLSSLIQPDITGRVRVGTPDDYATHFLPGIFSRFASDYPHVEVEVRCEPSASLLRRLQAGELDLSLVSCAPGEEIGEILWQEPTVWAVSRRHPVHEQDPIPLALFEPGCWFRDWALNVLGSAGCQFRIAYTSASIAGVQAAISSGLAVGVLGLSTLPADVRSLREEEGFPPLPSTTIALLRRSGAHSKAVDCLRGCIFDAFRDNLQATPRAGPTR